MLHILSILIEREKLQSTEKKSRLTKSENSKV
jgi:hypothetical protein